MPLPSPGLLCPSELCLPARLRSLGRRPGEVPPGRTSSFGHHRNRSLRQRSPKRASCFIRSLKLGPKATLQGRRPPWDVAFPLPRLPTESARTSSVHASLRSAVTQGPPRAVLSLASESLSNMDPVGEPTLFRSNEGEASEVKTQSTSRPAPSPLAPQQGPRWAFFSFGSGPL